MLNVKDRPIKILKIYITKYYKLYESLDYLRPKSVIYR